MLRKKFDHPMVHIIDFHFIFKEDGNWGIETIKNYPATQKRLEWVK